MPRFGPFHEKPLQLVYVLDVGFSPPRILAIGLDSAGGRVLTVLGTSGVTRLGRAIFPSPQLSRSTAGLSVPSMLYIDADGRLTSMLDAGLAASSYPQCVYPSQTPALPLPLPLPLPARHWVDASVYVGLSGALQQKLNAGRAATQSATFDAQVGPEFSTTDVQGAFLTFAAMGDAAYFTDPQAQNFTLDIHDIHTVHFLEPLSSKVLCGCSAAAYL